MAGKQRARGLLLFANLMARREDDNRVAMFSGLPDNFGFHHLRDVVISYAMPIVCDLMALGRLAGPSDGGVFVGETCGHIANTRRAAAKINFGLQ